MDFSVFLILSAAFVMNFCSLAVLGYAYFITKSRFIVYFALFLLSITMRQVFYAFLEYRLVTIVFGYTYAQTTVEYIIASLTIFTLPLVCHEWLNISHAQKRNLFFACLAVIAGIMVAVSPLLIPGYLDSVPDRFYFVAQPTFVAYKWIWYLTLLYVLSLGPKALKQANRREDRWFVVFAIFSVAIWVCLEAFDFIKSFPESFIPGAIHTLIGNLFIIFYITKVYIPHKDSKVIEPISPDQFLEQYKITEREKEVVDLIALGESNKAIAQKLFLSEATVKTHIINIYRKLDVRNRVQLVNLIKSRQNRTEIMR